MQPKKELAFGIKFAIQFLVRLFLKSIYRTLVREDTTMDFYNERKWCKKCKKYVRFLMSDTYSYCIHCDHKVYLFNHSDMIKFKKSPIFPE